MVGQKQNHNQGAVVIERDDVGGGDDEVNDGGCGCGVFRGADAGADAGHHCEAEVLLHIPQGGEYLHTPD